MQRAPRQYPDAVALAGRQDLQLGHPRGEVVQGLLTDQAVRGPAAGCLLSLGDVPAGEVRRPGVDDLALAAQDIHRLPDLVPRRGPVDVMHLVQVDMVGAQPAQRVIAGPADVQRGQEPVVRPLPLAAVQLGGQHRAVPAAAALAEPAANDLLGHALGARLSVGVRSVEEVDPVLVRAVHDLVRRCLLGDRAEVHRAEAEPADRDAAAAQVGVVHPVTVRRPGRHRSPPAMAPALR